MELLKWFQRTVSQISQTSRLPLPHSLSETLLVGVCACVCIVGRGITQTSSRGEKSLPEDKLVSAKTVSPGSRYL